MPAIRLELYRPDGSYQGDIWWDSEKGEITGLLADIVREMCEECELLGSCPGHPMPRSLEISDPFRLPRDMAIVLGSRWRIPSPLIEEYPVWEGEFSREVLY